MLCCIAAIAVIAWIRRVWWFLTLRGHAGERTTLPPRVHRPAPGSTVTSAPGSAVTAAPSRPTPIARGAGRPRLALALVVGGAAWLLGSELAVHGLGLFVFVRDNDVAHILFHGSGPLLMVLGLAVHPALIGRLQLRQLRWHS